MTYLTHLLAASFGAMLGFFTCALLTMGKRQDEDVVAALRRNAEMRKALEALPLDAFPEEQEYTIDGALFISHSARFFAAMILARRALKGAK